MFGGKVTVKISVFLFFLLSVTRQSSGNETLQWYGHADIANAHSLQHYSFLLASLRTIS